MELVVASCFYGAMAYSPYVSSLMASAVLLNRKGITFDFWTLPNDPYLWRARNIVANQFLETKFTDLILIDADMEWTPDAFIKILEADVDLVAVSHLCKCDWEKWASIPLYNADGSVTRNEQGLILAQTLSPGLMKIRRNVFEEIIKKNPEYWEIEGHKKYDFYSHLKIDNHICGEDVSFSKRWTVIGGKLWIVPDCTITHYGFSGYKGNFAEYLNGRTNV